ncbi:MAG: Mov34/MPN/PAD-1 family protein [Candidatus Bathyarchaeia archaeon]|jgi:proteasome lid subunit RPN8/RPN11
MGKTVYLSELCLASLITSCLETPHKETGGILIGKEDKRFVKGQRTDCLVLDVAYPVQTSESGKSFWVPSNRAAYNRIKDTINSMSFQIIGEYHSHINSPPELSKDDKDFIKGEVFGSKKNGVEPPNWLELVLNIESKTYTRKHAQSFDCSFLKKRVRFNIRGINSPLVGYSITVSAYQFNPETESFEEANIHIP